MNPIKKTAVSFLGGLGLAMAALSFAPSAHANVYASNIKLNGALSNASVGQGSGVTISYILNEPATLGTTLKILSGTNVVRTYSYASGSNGALRGLNTVTWDGKNAGGSNVVTGSYGVSVTASAVGFTNWTQTSIDTNSGMAAYYPLGIAVDNNTNSLYYGRVVISNPLSGTSPQAKIGLYKMNADGTQADEGWYGNANYLADDGGDGAVAGQMANSGGYDPMKLRIGEDDRLYWVDNSFLGRILATDMQATTNQIVISEPGWNGMAAYGDTGDFVGFQVFDVSATTTTNAAIWLADNDFPNWGIWMFHMTNGVADPADNVGSQAVTTGGDLQLVSSGGVMVDYNLDIFVGQSRSSDAGSVNADYYAMEFTNWNGGVLAPEGQNYTYATGTAVGQANWAYGTGVNMVGTNDPTFLSVQDTVINSRINPTMVACALGKGTQNSGGGLRVLNATNGTLIATNLDWGQQYRSAAWDNVGNLYGGSTTLNVWRVFSPPGTNQATTVAVEAVIVIPPIVITKISVSGSTVTVNFTSSTNDTTASFSLLSSSAVNPLSGYASVAGTVIAQVSPGVFTATAATSGSARYYRIKHN